MTAPDAADIRDRLRTHILSSYLFTDDPYALDDDESFQQTRIIDSMGMMQLVAFVEETFAVRILDADMVPERLDSVNRLVDLIQEKAACQ